MEREVKRPLGRVLTFDSKGEEVRTYRRRYLTFPLAQKAIPYALLWRHDCTLLFLVCFSKNINFISTFHLANLYCSPHESALLAQFRLYTTMHVTLSFFSRTERLVLRNKSYEMRKDEGHINRFHRACHIISSWWAR